MPRWTITHHTGRAEIIEADRIEDDNTGWSFWTVLLVVYEPRWSCLRRISAADVIGKQSSLNDQSA